MFRLRRLYEDLNHIANPSGVSTSPVYAHLREICGNIRARRDAAQTPRVVDKDEDSPMVPAEKSESVTAAPSEVAEGDSPSSSKGSKSRVSFLGYFMNIVRLC